MNPLMSWKTFKTIFTKEEVFSLDGIQFGIKKLTKRKAKDIEGYQAKSLKNRGPILIPHIYKLINLEAKQGFPKPWTQSLIIPISKSVDKNNHSDNRSIMTIPIFTNLYGIILENKISIWLES